MSSRFLSLTYDGTEGAWLSAKGKTYRLMRAGVNAERPPVGYATVMSDSGNRRKPISAEDRPIGNVLHDIVQGVPIEPRAREWIVIVLSDEDWRKLESTRKFRVVK